MSLSTHPLQSFEWGDFRKKTGIKVIQEDNFQLTIHKIPYLPWTIGYVPKGPMPTSRMIKRLKEIGEKEKCIFIQLEPNAITIKNLKLKIKNLGLQPATHPLFTKYTFILDLTKNEQELLVSMHPKTRYNIRVAQKHNVKVVEDNSNEAFETYLRLTKETTKRQGFYAHTENYHRLMWDTLKCQMSRQRRGSPEAANVKCQNLNTDKLTAHLFLANYEPSTMNHHMPVTLVAWILFVYKDTLYYPYGASSSRNRETMASNLMMWEAIKFGKKLGLKKLDLWGALGPNPDRNDLWYGFHRFKQGYGGQLTEFIGSFDLVINPLFYTLYKALDKVRWAFLRLTK